MKLQLTETEIDKVLLDIFSNGALGELNASGIDYVFNKDNYSKSKVQGNTFEDNLLSLLKNGGRLKFYDMEGGEDTVFLTYDLAKGRLSEVTDTERIQDIKNILDEDCSADSWTGYNLIQFLLYGEVIFG